MTISVNGTDIVEMIEIAATVGGILAMLVIGLIVYLMVRPPRRQEPPATIREDDPEILRALELMDRRMSLIEQALAERHKEEEVTNAQDGDSRRETRRVR